MALPRPVARAISILGLILGLALALAASLMTTYQTAKATPRIGFPLTVTLIVFFICVFVVTKLAATLWKANAKRLPLYFSACLTAIFAVALSLTVLRPMRYPHLSR